MTKSNIEIICEVSTPMLDGWNLCLQWTKYNYSDNSPSQMGYRFIYRKPDTKLQPARGQARIPAAADMLRLIQRATEAGWFITCEAGRTDQPDVIVEEDES